LHGADTEFFECLVIESATILLPHEAKNSMSSYLCTS